METTASSTVARFTADYRAASTCSFGPRVSDVVAGTVHRFGSGTRRDYEAAQRAFDHAVAVSEVEVVEGRVYTVAA